MSETRGRGEAHGKFILLGEHAVVYGTPALAAGLPRGASATATWRDDGGPSVLAVAPWTVEVDASSDTSLSKAFAALLREVDPSRPVRVEARVDVPSGAGLGSSAALGVAAMRAIDALEGTSRDASSAFDVSLAWERVFHGNPSGVDGAMAIAGGLGFFVRGQPVEPVRARKPLHVVVGDSAEPCSTKAMVDSVARQHARSPERLEKTFAAITAIVKNGRLAIEAGDARALGQLLDMNQSLLASMLVSTATLEEMIATARAAGALGAKLTGGGGGGCMIALAEDEESAAAIAGAIASSGKRTFVARIGDTSE